MIRDLGRFFDNVWEDEVNLSFAVVMVSLFLLAMIFARFPTLAISQLLSRTVPTTLTVLGILGTFVGIYLGLLDFDVKNVDASVPKLLSGMKIAFATSIFGMTLGVFYRLIEGAIQPKEVRKGVSAEDILAVMKGVRADIQTLGDTQMHLLTDLKSAIVGESDEDTLLTSTSEDISDLESTEQWEVLSRGLVSRAAKMGIPMPLLGGVAVRVCCRKILREIPALEVPVRKIDMAGYTKDRQAIERLMRDAGLNADREFNISNGNERLKFTYQARGAETRFDVFLDRLRMYHEVSFRGRLDTESLTVSPTDLLLSKLQIVGLPRREIMDIVAIGLAFEFLTEVKDSHDPVIDMAYIADLCANEWGYYRTVVDNLRRLQSEDFAFLPAAYTPRLRKRLERLLEEIYRVPKPWRWRMRSVVGTRVKWYGTPMEV